MCLAIPGKIVKIDENPLLRMGKVSFAGVIKEVSLIYVPNTQVNDYVLVHAGFAISEIDEGEAKQVFEYLQQAVELLGEDTQ